MENESDNLYSYPDFSEPVGTIEMPKKQLIKVQLIPYAIRFSLIWTIFFAILGIAIQSILAKSFIFSDFFAKNYIDWFTSFGGFTRAVSYGGVTNLIYSIFNHWYYFFYTGGLISLLWEVISGIIHFEFVVKKKTDYSKIRETAEEQRARMEKENEQLSHGFLVSKLIIEGKDLLAKNKLVEAKQKYEEIRQAYSKEQDKGGIIQKKAVDFYNEILKKEKEKINSKFMR